MSTHEIKSELSCWLAYTDQRPVLAFTEQGWALAEACAHMTEFEKPQALVVFVLIKIINEFVEDASASGPDLPIDWTIAEDASSARLAFPLTALQGVAGVCGMTLDEFQTTIQSSMEEALLHIYESDKSWLH